MLVVPYELSFALTGDVGQADTLRILSLFLFSRRRLRCVRRDLRCCHRGLKCFQQGLKPLIALFIRPLLFYYVLAEGNHQRSGYRNR